MSFQLPSYEELNNVPYSSNGDNNCDDLIIWFNEEAYKNLWNIAASSKKDEVETPRLKAGAKNGPLKRANPGPHYR